MVTLTGTVRPPSIWKLKEFTELYSGVHNLRLCPEDRRLLVRALTNVLLLHWPGLAEQRWDEREKHLTKFLRDLTGQFRQLHTDGFASNRSLQAQAQPVIKDSLRIIGDLVENVLNEITQTKTLCYNCVKEYLDIALWLFPIYVGDAAVCEELFAFFHTVFDVLKAQMGAAAVEEAIVTFLNLFGKDQMSHAILNEDGGGSGVRAIEKFLGILEFVIKEPGVTFRKFVPSTLSLCLDHIYPLVASKPSADIKAPLYSLLTSVLKHNWSYFFKGSLVRQIGVPGRPEEVMNRAEFLAILQAYGQSFLQPDIAVFRQNLEALEHLNKKWKLYRKVSVTLSVKCEPVRLFA